MSLPTQEIKTVRNAALREHATSLAAQIGNLSDSQMVLSVFTLFRNLELQILNIDEEQSQNLSDNEIQEKYAQLESSSLPTAISAALANGCREHFDRLVHQGDLDVSHQQATALFSHIFERSLPANLQSQVQ